MALRDLFKVSTHVKTNSIKNNKVSITSNSDTLFEIGKDLGEIKTLLGGVEDFKEQTNTKLEDHEHRIKKLESK